jgi:hypothetical protein
MELSIFYNIYYLEKKKEKAIQQLTSSFNIKYQKNKNYSLKNHQMNAFSFFT